MFYFQQLFNQGLNGVDRTNLMDGIRGISYAILLLGFLIGMYQAVLRGGDLRALVTTGLKYLVVGIVIANWSGVFRQVNNSANDVAQFISNSTNSGDTFTVWLQQLKQQYSTDGNQKIIDLVSETAASIISILLLFCAYIVYPCALVIFSLFYTLYGVLLYVVGPLILALLPMAGMGQMAKSFSINLMIWNFWGILYAIFGALISVINADQMNSILNQHGFLGFFQGLGNATLLGLISIFYALALALIPFIAKRVVGGEVGETMFTFMRAAGTAAGLAMAGAAGMSSMGASAAGSEGGGGGSASPSGSEGGSGSSSSTAPREAAGLGQVIQRGVASATGQGSAPAESKGSGGSDGGKNNGGGQKDGQSSSTNGAANGHGQDGNLSYRPHGVAQFLAYHGGRAAAGAMQSAERTFGSEETSGQKSKEGQGKEKK